MSYVYICMGEDNSYEELIGTDLWVCLLGLNEY